MPTLGPVELIVILVIVAMLFGVGKLPEVFGAVGKGIREFRRNSDIPDEQDENDAEETKARPVQSSSAQTSQPAPPVAEAPEPAPAEETTSENKPSDTQQSS
jgi:sec-independent protein translocase protein TatA